MSCIVNFGACSNTGAKNNAKQGYICSSITNNAKQRYICSSITNNAKQRYICNSTTMLAPKKANVRYTKLLKGAM